MDFTLRQRLLWVVLISNFKIMKKINRLFTAIIISTSLLVGCSKFLDLDPPYTQDAENFFQNEQDYLRALTGAYDLLQGMFVSYPTTNLQLVLSPLWRTAKVMKPTVMVVSLLIRAELLSMVDLAAVVQVRTFNP